MLTTVKGYFDHGKIVLNETPPAITRANVFVTFITEDEEISDTKRRIPGKLKGKLSIPADFNEPLEDLQDYM